MSLNALLPQQQAFVIKRGLLGLYVCFHFAALLPYAVELFSSSGMLGKAGASPLIALFPNLLAWCDAPAFVQGFLALGAVAGGCLACGWLPRLSALLAYYVWACLFGRNPLIANPSLPYVGLMLVVCAVVGRPRKDTSAKDWQRVTTLLWLAMAVGYSYSGVTKLSSPSWLDGTGVQAILQSPLARPHALRSWLLALAPVWLTTATYGTLLLEVAFAPLSVVARLRPWLWLSLTAMHVSLLCLIQFADLSLGMLVLHAFTFDPAWLEQGKVVWPRLSQSSPHTRSRPASLAR